MPASDRKRELDRQRTEWRNKHRTLDGRVILYPDKDPEHVNARASRLYNWFWKKILLMVEPQDIPGIISGLRKRMDGEADKKNVRTLRTMIGMAEDAYQLEKLNDIKDQDSELLMGEKNVSNSESGVIFKAGTILTADFSEDESEILVRDIEGILVDILSTEDVSPDDGVKQDRTGIYRDWSYAHQ